MDAKGIDVAKWNGNIDWKKVRDSGVKFAILKVINKQNKVEDSFERNYAGASLYGLPIDVYNYSYASDTAKAVVDAKKVVEVLDGRRIGYVWLDLEERCHMGIGKRLVDIINAYKQVIESAGYKFGVYTGLSFYNSYLGPFHTQFDCKVWMARYPLSLPMTLFAEPPVDKKPSILHPLWGWQYTSKGRVDGINGDVDLSIRYGDTNFTTLLQVLKKGDTGFEVKRLQMLLNGKGYDCGNVDGDFGNNTLSAVKKFQTDNGLAADGVVGTRTWTVLESDTESKVKEFSLAADGEKYVSKNFKVKEFRCKDGSDKILIDVDFVQNYLQKIRDFFGPVTINSGYRTKAYNTRVGGAKSSYHLQGRAFDIVAKGFDAREVAEFASKLGINGVIFYADKNFVHVDSRTTKYWAVNTNGKAMSVSDFRRMVQCQKN